ncbi:MAG: hypothetical protein CMB32_02100 [Euryarchaeota archaeon]|nr:hypothetical protein [Euryarchaeota archaeon]|tara:strand:+ start:2069 stop:5311 length:3243 start_codon:yes stop_codon:yes gene_type:complete
MISKYLSFGAMAAGALLIGTFTQLGTSIENIEVSDYSPRQSYEEIPRDAQGAAEITRMLLGDVETGEINAQGLAELRNDVVKFAKKQAQRQAKSSGLSWTEMGPDNVGGRTRALAIHPENESILYAGAVSGGLWKSGDEANSWVQLSGFPSLMVGSIAVAGNGDVYVGTGSEFDWAGGEGNSGFRGRGIYMSTDDGQTFTMVDGTDPGEFGSGDFSAIDALCADPTNDDRVWYGSSGSYGHITNGVIVEDPGSGGPANVSDIAIASDGSYMMVAALNGKVYRADDFAEGEPSFASISAGGSGNGMLPQSGVGRARIAISIDDPEHAFALFATSGGLFHGLHYSSESGEAETWSECWPGGIDTSTPLERAQGIYDLALGVTKNDPTLAYVGGISLWRSGPFQQAEQAAAPIDIPGFNYGVHADIQDIVIAPESGTMYVTTDGGIYKSTDGGQSYVECNHNYNVTQFYGIAHSAKAAVMGGTQDNGSLFIPTTGGFFLSDQSAIEVHGGDGFDCAISMVTESEEHSYAWFGASQNGGLVRGTIAPGQVSNLGDFYDDDIIELMTDEGDLGGFYTCVRLYEDTEDENSQRNVILVNPYGETVTDSTFELNTSNQNLPFSYTLSEGEELLYHDMIVRPELLLEQPLTEDPNYFWLSPQENEEQFTCWDDTLGSETVQVISEIIPNVLDTTIVVDGIEYDVQIDLGNDTIWTEEVQYDIVEVCDTMYYHFADTIYDQPGRILVQDPYTTIFTLGLNGSNGIWMTRDGLNFNTTPDWIRLGNAPSGSGAKSIEYVVNDDAAGDVMFVSGWNGQLLRISGLSNVYSQDDVEEHVVIDELLNEGAAITGVSIDPNNANHVVVTLGSYGTIAGGKVRESWDALSEDPSFTNIWTAGLNKMPMYDVVINSKDESGASIIVGCEYGVFETTDGGSNWTMANIGMSNNLSADGLACPIFDLKQQWRSETNWSIPTNTGAIYAGSHGRGIFRSDDYLGAEEIVDNTPDAFESLLVYPNPVSESTVSVSTAGFAGIALVEIYDLQGRVVISERLTEANASDRVVLDVSTLLNGTYVVRMANDYKNLASKLVVRK